MTANEELQAVRHTEQRMRALEIQLSAINRDLHSESIQICESGDAMPRISKHLQECREELNREWDELIDSRNKVKQVINQITDGQYRDVLNLRYINALPWEQIAVELGYSWRQVHRLHKKAIAEFEKMA